MANNRNSVHRF